MSDPVDVVAEYWSTRPDHAYRYLSLARGALEALQADGWRLVRTDNCADPSAPIGHCGCVETRITEEWQP